MKKSLTCLVVILAFSLKICDGSADCAVGSNENNCPDWLQCMENDTDYPGQDLSSGPSTGIYDCYKKCKDQAGCQAFMMVYDNTHISHQPVNYCWLKSQKYGNGATSFIGLKAGNMDCFIEIDGGLSAFGQWSACSTYCGEGQQTRERICNNPAPANGGADCEGSLTETQNCNSAGPCPEVENIASKGMAKQTDTMNNYNAELAIDGDNNGIMTDNSLTHTLASGSNAWWSLTYPRSMYIKEIQIFGRTDCCEDRIDGASVLIDGTEVGTLNSNDGPPMVVPVNKPGSEIMIRNREGGDVQSLAEVLVMGAETGKNWLQCMENDTDYPGQDLSSGPSTGIDDCYKKCKDQAGCQAFMMVYDNTHISHQPVNYCWLKSQKYGNGATSFIGLKAGNMDCFLEIDGGLSAFGQWSACSTNYCGEREQTRERICNNPAPANGGANCVGSLTEAQNCNSAGPCPEVENIASKGMAKQTDTMNNYNAELAIDGDNNGIMTDNSLTHTLASGSNAWWSLTYPRSMYIKEIQIFGRTDCCEDRIDGASVLIDGTEVGTLNSNDGPPMVVPVNKPGSEIMIRNREGGDVQSLAEVLVMGAETGKNWLQCMDTDTDYPEHDLTSGTSTGIDDCYKKCKDQAGCQAFVMVYDDSAFSGTLNYCWLKSQKYGAGAETVTGLKAGNMDCFKEIDGGLSAFGQWSACSTNYCGEREQTRERICNNPAPANGGANCVGSLTEAQNCNSAGPCPEVENIASKGMANQTDTMNNYNAELAIDGDNNGIMTDNSLTHTLALGSNAWWSLTYPRSMYIKEIQIFGRTDCCEDRIDGASVLIDGTEVGTLNSNDGPPMVVPVNKAGSEIMIRNREGGDAQSLAEVLVMGAETGKNWLQCMDTDTDYPGHDLTSGTSTGIDDCYKKCKDQAGCQAFVMVYDDSAFSGTLNYCWLKSQKYGTGAQTVTGLKAGNMDCFKEIDGGLSAFGVLSVCSTYCGEGQQTRERSCDNPAPANGGANCEGSLTEAQNCNSGPCPEVKNIASKGMAKQTDTMNNYNAELAIDGDNNGIMTDNSLTHTLALGSNAWWSLTYPRSMYIKEIQIFGRTDCCEDRIDGASVLIDGTEVGTLNSNDGPPMVVPVNKAGSEIMIRNREGGEVQSLAEVLVMGAETRNYWLQCMDNDTDYPGQDLSSGTSTGIDDCYKKCKDQADCQAFVMVYDDSVFSGTLNYCWLKSQKYGAGASPKKGLTAGNMDCLNLIDSCTAITVNKAQITGATQPASSGQTITITCNNGYIISGNSELTCDGTDFGTLPTCQIQQCATVTVEHALITPSQPVNFDITITITCNNGYSLSSGNGELTCDGTDFGTLPTCQIQQCATVTVEHALITPSQPVNFDITITITCNNGYSLSSGNGELTCDGTDFGTLPTCQIQQCATVTVEHALITPSQPVNFDITITITCNNGYSLSSGNGELTCDGTDFGTLPTCQIQQCATVTVEHALITPSQPVNFDITITITCNNGYSLSSGNGELTCDGTDFGTLPTCQIQQCATVTVEHALITPSQPVNFDITITITCNNGYSLSSGNGELTCDGTDFGTLPTCQIQQCATVTVEHALITPSQPVNFDITITITCNNGYSLSSGNGELTCDGTDFGTLPTCQIQQCATVTVEHALITPSQPVNFDITITITCNNGYSLSSGNGELTCDGTDFGTLPTCQIQQCATVTVEHALITPSQPVNFDITITITCNNGYSLSSGNGELTCDGTDFGTLPTCQIQQCATVTVEHALITPSQPVNFDITITITCNNGYSLSSGNGELTCDGTDFGTLPTCQIQQCSPITVDNGAITPSQPVNHGVTITVTCNNGNVINGDSELICQGGIFNVDTPTCTCPGGSYYTEEGCKTCPTSHWMAGGDNADSGTKGCNTCPGVKTSSEGSTSESDCHYNTCSCKMIETGSVGAGKFKTSCACS
ncbi:uncharacterized protein LOC134822438 [Bolinopsis microptera]|uniref:uncharacterized protein LOC134822438 n=1 Tax=Bolinopsis microptera TaxID=2820187 RepID=UPI00307A4641